MVNWNAERAKMALNSFYMKADMQTSDDNSAATWIATNSDEFFDVIDHQIRKDGTLDVSELQILYEANGMLLDDSFRQGIARLMHPVIQNMGVHSRQCGPINKMQFKHILEGTFMNFGLPPPAQGYWCVPPGHANNFGVNMNMGGMYMGPPGMHMQMNMGGFGF